MKRGLWLIAASVCGGMFAIGLGHASPAQDAKKVCAERYEVEKKGNTLPAGMSKAKYLTQCTTSILRNAKLEAELKAQDQSAQQSQTGGQNELTPKPEEQAKQTTSRSPH